jgi:hypothetical protein
MMCRVQGRERNQFCEMQKIYEERHRIRQRSDESPQSDSSCRRADRVAVPRDRFSHPASTGL